MGVVYVSRVANEDRFTVGAAKSFEQRRGGGYDRYNPQLKLYRLLEHTNHFALEKFIHNELSERRIQGIASESWYSVTQKEMDLAISKAKTFGQRYLECKKQVASIKNARTNGNWREPDEQIKMIHEKLTRLMLEKQRICQKEAMLKMEAMTFIGECEGGGGAFSMAVTRTTQV